MRATGRGRCAMRNALATPVHSERTVAGALFRVFAEMDWRPNVLSLPIVMLILGVTSIIVQYGYHGMLVAAFLAGSFIPFSSEAILTALYASGLQLWPLILMATAGNVLGGVFNYSVGRLCNEAWVYRIFRVKEERLEKTKERIRRRGVWMGLLAWLPVLGSVITIALGILRVNFPMSLLTMAVGKFGRYLILGYLISLA